jgi:hypothetical protein
MKRRSKLLLVVLLSLIVAVLTLPIWGMGPAVFLDSERTILSRSVSPDGKRIAQVERLVVGGVPNIVIIVRPTWMPNWYLAGCAAASHYQETKAAVRWIRTDKVEVAFATDLGFWSTDSAPFHHGGCLDLELEWKNVAAESESHRPNAD